jgi:hypothetical protein
MEKLIAATASWLVVLGFSASVQAESWKARQELIAEKSQQRCQQSNPGYTYALDLNGAVLSIVSSANLKFTAAVAANGGVNQETKSPTGATIVLSGNAQTRELELLVKGENCRYKLTVI